MRHLLNQSTNSKIDNNLLIKIWSFMALVITACFSGGILNKILTPEHFNINTFEEMAKSGLQVYTYNNSWSWWQFKAFDEGWTKNLDEKFSMVRPRINFIEMRDFYNKIELVANGKAIFMCELSLLIQLKFQYSKLSIEIAENKYYYTLFGFPIYKNRRNSYILVEM